MPKVFVVNRPIRNKFGWTPDLSDASRYGSIEVVFEPDDNPQVCSISNDNESKKDYERLLARGLHSSGQGGGDPIAVMMVFTIASEFSPVVRVLRWERNLDRGDMDRRQGWYMPVALNLRKEKV